MELREFVEQTIVQIIDGVVAAQAHVKTVGGRVNPVVLPTRTAQGKVYATMYRDDQEREIEFDVAVSTTDGQKTQGGVGLFVGPIALGTKGEAGGEVQQVSRIRFSVPVVLPHQIEDTGN